MRNSSIEMLGMIAVVLCVAGMPCHAAETNVTTAQIVGVWSDSGATNDVSGQRITVFNADGTYTETVTLRFQGKNKIERLTGKWKLDGSTLETVTATSSNPNVEKPGEVTKLKVAAVTEDTLVLQYDDGEKETLKRVKK